MDDSGTTASFAEEDELYRLAEQRGLETLSAARAEAWQAKAEACRCRLCGGAAPAKLPPRPRCLAVDAPAAGHAVLFPGRVEHGGHPISKGVRYIIVLCAAPPRKRIASNTAPPCVVVRVSNHSLLPEGSAASLAW